MVMTAEVRPDPLISHHWLRHEDDTHYHAYLSARPGTPSVCSEGKPIVDWTEMSIPGDRSTCCGCCGTKLFGYNWPIDEA